MFRVTKSSGFSLIELMIVVMIIGLLSATIAPKIMNRPDEARISKVHMDIKTFETALKMYHLDNSVYPTTEQGLESLIDKPKTEPIPNNWREGGYLEASVIPKDPWGNDYAYRSPAGKEFNVKFEILSFGPSGPENKEDNISSLDIDI
ncbi:MAG: type II secretion system major pseudopilin GspG [Minisyncoccales bacterium]